jgi:hypothetical protein
MANRRGRTIPSVHLELVPPKGTMAGNLLVIGVCGI